MVKLYGFCLSIAYIARRRHPHIESLPTHWCIYIYHPAQWVTRHNIYRPAFHLGNCDPLLVLHTCSNTFFDYSYYNIVFKTLAANLGYLTSFIEPQPSTFLKISSRAPVHVGCNSCPGIGKKVFLHFQVKLLNFTNSQFGYKTIRWLPKMVFW